MPRDGSGNYSVPAGTLAVTDTTIDSAKYNAFVNDIQQDANTPRPVVAGGTGASNAAGAMANLGGELAKQVIADYNVSTFQPGSFYSDNTTGRNAPVNGHAFIGICYAVDANNMFIQARDQSDPSTVYLRQMNAGVWGSWVSSKAVIAGNTVYIADTAPATPVDGSLWWRSDIGQLYVRYNDGDSSQWVAVIPPPLSNVVTSFKGRVGAVVPAQGDYTSNLIPGTTTNDDAAAGNIGEYQTAQLAGGSSVPVVTNTPKDIVTMSLTAGDWDVWGHVFLNNIGASGTLQYHQAAISAGAANTMPGGLDAYTAVPVGIVSSGALPNNSIGLPVLPVRIKLAATTTVRLVYNVNSTLSSLNAYGILQARRRR